MNTVPTNLPHDLHPKPPHVDHDLRPWLGSASVVLALLALGACAVPSIAMAALPLGAVALAMGAIDMKKSYGRKGPWLVLAVLGCLLSVAAFITAAKIGTVARRAMDESISMPVQPATPKTPAQ
jgi:hypothetical protein